MMTEGRYNNEELLVRLRAVFGRVDQVRNHIDRALQQDDAHCRKRDMRFLIQNSRKTSEDRTQREEMKEQTKWLPLRKESQVNFKNILKNRWT